MPREIFLEELAPHWATKVVIWRHRVWPWFSKYPTECYDPKLKKWTFPQSEAHFMTKDEADKVIEELEGCLKHTDTK
jgi:hypothetical protein